MKLLNPMTFTYPLITMLEKYYHIAQLIIKKLCNNATEDEANELQNWRIENEENERLVREMTTESVLIEKAKAFQRIDTEAALKKAHAIMRRKEVLLWYLKLPAAAAIVGLICLGIFGPNLLKDTSRSTANGSDTTGLPNYRAVPGHDRATLTLSNGFEINLGQANDGAISSEAGIQVQKADGIIKYYTLYPDLTAGQKRNSLRTPRGGKYQVQLPDGSKVWLNAASSITYPLTYSTSKRWVEITGEAYFEVKSDKTKPFIVKVNGTEVEAVGTRFNINAYANNEVIRTSLFEGKLNITSGNRKDSLHAGQDAVFTAGSQIKVAQNPNIEDAIAWKNGLFSFHEASIVSIMQQLERWYDIEVIYLDTPKNSVTLHKDRTTSLDDIIIELNNVINITKQGNKVIVSSK
jgi:transmembrane sensor